LAFNYFVLSIFFKIFCSGQNHEERGLASDGVGTVPGQEGARDQEHRLADTRGSPPCHSG